MHSVAEHSPALEQHGVDPNLSHWPGVPSSAGQRGPHLLSVLAFALSNRKTTLGNEHDVLNNKYFYILCKFVVLVDEK